MLKLNTMVAVASVVLLLGTHEANAHHPGRVDCETDPNCDKTSSLERCDAEDRARRELLPPQCEAQ